MNMISQNYILQSKLWPAIGRHIVAQYNNDTIVVYQAFKPSIADYAVKHQKFGGTDYNLGRMTWIKTNFLWMMYRSGWSCKPNQERILAIYLSIDGFEEILRNAYTTQFEKSENANRENVNVRLQWDPDHDPLGNKVDRRAIQLGLKNHMVTSYNEKWIQKICDITDFVKAQHEYVVKGEIDKLVIPLETVYKPRDQSIYKRIGLDEWT